MSNDTTTIQISTERRDELREERKPYESNYDETIGRLLGNASGGQLWTQQEIQDMIDRRIEEANRGRL